MSQAGEVDVVGSHPEIVTTIVTDDGTAVSIANTIELLTALVPAGTTPLETIASGNTVTINAQYSQAIAATDATRVGLAAFDSADFAVDANGFVTFVGGGGFVTSVSGTLNRITSTGGVTPVIDIAAGYIGQASITTLGTIATGIWQGTVIGMTYGGTGANLTPSNGGIFYSTGTTGAILAGTATARQMLQSGASTTPAWSTATYPATTTANQVLYSSATNVVGEITTAANMMLTTDGSGVPSWSTEFEQGTFVPEYQGSTGNPSPTYTLQVGRYQRVGDVVWVSCRIDTSASSGGSGSLRVTLPFTSASAGNNILYCGSCLTSNFTLGSSVYNISRISTNVARFEFGAAIEAAAYTQLLVGSLPTAASGISLATITYGI